MKKLMITATVLAFSFGAIAQDSVTSVNAAGFVKKILEPEDFYMIQNPFERFDGGTNTVEEVFEALPLGSTVYLWDGDSQTFVVVQKLTPTFWNPPGLEVERGQGVFVRVPPGAEASDLFLVGEVPGATSHSNTVFNLLPGFNAVGNPYPVDITIEESGINEATQPGDQVALWNSDTQSFVIAQKLTPTFWNPPNTVIPVGGAVFVKILDPSGSTYVESVPYSWPDN